MGFPRQSVYDSIVNPINPPTLPSASRRRSWFITLLGWAIIIISGLLVPISVISFLMILAGSHGTSTFDPVGFVLIVIAPAASLVAGIGLIRRCSWARRYVIVLLGLLIAYNAWELFAGRPETTTYTSSTGQTTTVQTSYGGRRFHLPAVVIGTLLLAGLCKRSVGEEFRPTAPPPIPGVSGARAAAVRSSSAVPAMSAGAASSPVKQRLALWVVIALLIAFAGGMGWLTAGGISGGTTHLPTNRASRQRSIVRQEEPAMFWLSIGVYCAAGLVSAAAAVWLMRQARRQAPTRPPMVEDYER